MEVAGLRAEGGELGGDGGVMGELPEDGRGLFFEGGLGGLDGLADAETHPGVFGDEDLIARSDDGFHVGGDIEGALWRLDEGKMKF